MRTIFLLLGLFCGIHTSFGQVLHLYQLGVLPSETKVQTEALQKALDSLQTLGGGQLVFPPGTYVTGSLRLYSNLHLQFMPGAVLKGSGNAADYPQKSLWVARNCTNLLIDGGGTIDGNGQAFYDADYQPAKDRPEPMLLFNNCRQLRVQNVQVVNSPSHVFRLLGCDAVYIDGVTIDNDVRSPNTDGIDVVDTRNVQISNCVIRTGDDAICLKNHGGKVENVVVTNCIIESDDGGIKLGTGSMDTVQHCSFQNIVIRNTRYALALFMQEGGVYRFIQFSNISIQTGGRQRNVYPIYIDVDKKKATGKLGTVEHISFSGLQIETQGNILMAGQPDAPLKNISVQNLKMVVRNCNDLSKQKKPRGNKRTPVFEDTKDMANVNAHITLGYIDGLWMRDVHVINECGNARPTIHRTAVKSIEPYINN